uniref:Uncharacterized protein n=1 Tax=Vespula pensylvanica TaxID=30213 RepID=A0A834NYN7_VESPE|nr:hypothetical protein H0235_009364 [Vespula pensylvanica]
MLNDFAVYVSSVEQELWSSEHLETANNVTLHYLWSLVCPVTSLSVWRPSRSALFSTDAAAFGTANDSVEEWISMSESSSLHSREESTVLVRPGSNRRILQEDHESHQSS